MTVVTALRKLGDFRRAIGLQAMRNRCNTLDLVTFAAGHRPPDWQEIAGPMARYLISFPDQAMKLSEDELARAGVDAHPAIDLAKAAGVFVFGGGIDESVDPVLVAADGVLTPGIYPGADMTGGFAVFELPTRQDAVEWARKITIACRCSQELREFMSDPAS